MEEYRNRRNGDKLLLEMHGLLERIDERTKNFDKIQQEHHEQFVEHKEDDDRNFKVVHDRIDPIMNTLLKVNGAWMVIVFIFGLLLKFWK